MKPEIRTRTVAALEPLSETAKAVAMSGPPTRARHDEVLLHIPELACLELQPPPNQIVKPRPSGHITIMAWNAERLKYAIASRALIGRINPDVILLSEVDVGMARSGNRHTVRDLASAIDCGFVLGVEFAELGLGDEREMHWHAGRQNTYGYHANAIISRYPLFDPFLIRLDDGAHWFVDMATSDQRRIGFRNAVGAQIQLPASGAKLAVVSTHFENRTSPQGRAEQCRRLIDSIDQMFGNCPVIIGGDFNTSALPTEAQALNAAFEQPEKFEPMFQLFRDAGFDWRSANTAEPTLRTRPDGTPQPPFTRIDWFFTRELACKDAATIAALDSDGLAISDHDPIRVGVKVKP